MYAEVTTMTLAQACDLQEKAGDEEWEMCVEAKSLGCYSIAYGHAQQALAHYQSAKIRSKSALKKYEGARRMVNLLRQLGA
jgi:hypothetical protein